MHITVTDYTRAAGCVPETAGRRLRAVSHHSGPRGTRLYPLADSLVTLKGREIAAGAHTALVRAASTPADSLYVGGADALRAARRLIGWLPATEADRFRAVRNMFFVAVANSGLCAPTIVENLGSLADLIVLQPDVLKFVFGVNSDLDIDRIAPAFSLVNNTVFEEVA